MIKLIQEFSKDLSDSLMDVHQNGCKNKTEFVIECGDLEDYNFIDIRDSDRYKSTFDLLKQMNGPVVYYFEVISNNSATDVLEKIRAYATKENSKAIPAIKKQFADSKILYVGKVKKSFWGRLIQHLGFYKVGKTQGLQLFYWAKELNLDIKVVVYEFEPEMADVMGVIENKIARELKPILGMHR